MTTNTRRRGQLRGQITRLSTPPGKQAVHLFGSPTEESPCPLQHLQFSGAPRADDQPTLIIVERSGTKETITIGIRDVQSIVDGLAELKMRATMQRQKEAGKTNGANSGKASAARARALREEIRKEALAYRARKPKSPTEALKTWIASKLNKSQKTVGSHLRALGLK